MIAFFCSTSGKLVVWGLGGLDTKGIPDCERDFRGTTTPRIPNHQCSIAPLENEHMLLKLMVGSWKMKLPFKSVLFLGSVFIFGGAADLFLGYS